MVVDALSRKSRGPLAIIASRKWQVLETMGQFGLQYIEHDLGTLILNNLPRIINKILSYL